MRQRATYVIEVTGQPFGQFYHGILSNRVQPSPAVRQSGEEGR
jgi:hypothetical protein